MASDFVRDTRLPISKKELEAVEELKEIFKVRVQGEYVNPKTLEYTDLCYKTVNDVLVKHGFKPKAIPSLENLLDRHFILRR